MSKTLQEKLELLKKRFELTNTKVTNYRRSARLFGLNERDKNDYREARALQRNLKNQVKGLTNKIECGIIKVDKKHKLQFGGTDKGDR
jgi:hypothetical protein